MLPMLDLLLERCEDLTREIRSFHLRNATGEALPVVDAGSHIDVQVPGDLRSYSLVNSEDSSGLYQIAVKREDAGRCGSLFMHSLKVGDIVRASAAKNAFALLAEPHRATLIAGGIGITPILAMARSLRARGLVFDMHYGPRHPELMAFTEETGFAAHYFDHGPDARGMDLDAILGRPEADRHVYVCSPKPLLDAALAKSAALGWRTDHVHFEVFGVGAQGGDQPITVHLRQSGRTLQVGARESILDVMLAAGLDPMYDCKRGECSTCMVKVLDGIPDHRDYALSASDRETQMCICVSRAKTHSLTLEA